MFEVIEYLRKRFICIVIINFVVVFLSFTVYSQPNVIRVELQSGISIVCRPSYQIFLECSSVPGKSLSQVLSSVLSDPTEAQRYVNLRSVALPLNKVRTSLYPQIFSLLFEQDQRTNEGWWHTVPQGYQMDDNTLNLWCMALTGITNRKADVMRHPENRGKKIPLSGGEKIFFPSHIFTPELKEQISKSVDQGEKIEQVVLEPIDIFDEEFPQVSPSDNGMAVVKDLEYGKDSQGEYALYKLKRGETIYAVIARFTDYTDHADILKACNIVKKRNKITNERAVEPGTSIKIPIDMLSDIYLPRGTEERRVAEEVRKEVAQLKKGKSSVRMVDSLRDVVVIIDPGHGGRDHGSPSNNENIYEDEINYDIACRLKIYLEEKTHAKVYITLKDKSQGFEPTQQQTFNHDIDEYVLVTPPYNPQDSDFSANLRWLLANSIIDEKVKTKIPKEKMIFISIHCNYFSKSTMRGLMVYIPGANHYKGIDSLPEKDYKYFKEWQGYRPKNYTVSQRIDAEARSRAFAQILITTARKKGIAVHSHGPSIRNVIRRSKNRIFVPSVLRNTDIPTKLMLECVNLNNPADLKNVADPNWRQKMAEIIAESLLVYFAK